MVGDDVVVGALVDGALVIPTGGAVVVVAGIQAFWQFSPSNPEAHWQTLLESHCPCPEQTVVLFETLAGEALLSPLKFWFSHDEEAVLTPLAGEALLSPLKFWLAPQIGSPVVGAGAEVDASHPGATTSVHLPMGCKVDPRGNEFRDPHLAS